MKTLIIGNMSRSSASVAQQSDPEYLDIPPEVRSEIEYFYRQKDYSIEEIPEANLVQTQQVSAPNESSTEVWTNLALDTAACFSDKGHQRTITVKINKQVERQLIVDPFHPFDAGEIFFTDDEGNPKPNPAELDNRARYKAQKKALDIARSICASCVSTDACTEWALQHAQDDNAIYGGLTQRERNRLSKRRNQ